MEQPNAKGSRPSSGSTDLSSLSRPERVNVVALGIAILAIVVQIVAGVDYPAVPPGPIILAITGGAVIFTKRRWASLLAVVVPLFLTVGGTIAFLADDEMALRHPDEVVAFGATAMQMAALVVAVAAGANAWRTRSGRGPEHRERGATP